ncbi:hypothetical protein J6590_010629 [Homalodisca vitripennis]|nr:hypothetical protein J6590_010629 [Homalodisca vitripennis]
MWLLELHLQQVINGRCSLDLVTPARAALEARAWESNPNLPPSCSCRHRYREHRRARVLVLIVVNCDVFQLVSDTNSFSLNWEAEVSNGEQMKLMGPNMDILRRHNM